MKTKTCNPATGKHYFGRGLTCQCGAHASVAEDRRVQSAARQRRLDALRGDLREPPVRPQPRA